MQEIVIIRHAKPRGGGPFFYIGQTDPSLSAAGFRAALELSQKVKVDKKAIVFTSPLQRALETARAAFPAYRDQFIIANELMEQHFGILEGVSITMAKKMYPELMQYLEKYPSNYNVASGENWDHIIARAKKFSKRILEQRQTIIIGHLNFTRALLEVLTGSRHKINLNYCQAIFLSKQKNETKWKIVKNNKHMIL